MNIANAEYLRTFARSVEPLKVAKMTTAALDVIDLECIVGLAQASMHEAELLKASHCHHGHGEGAHQHGQQTCIDCAGIVTFNWDFEPLGLLHGMTADKLKQHYVGRMVYGEAYKG